MFILQINGAPPTSLIETNEVADTLLDSKDNDKVEEEIEKPPTLTEALTQLGLPQLAATFEKEEIDFDSLVSDLSSENFSSPEYNSCQCKTITILIPRLSIGMRLYSHYNVVLYIMRFLCLQIMCSNDDLKEIGIPMGPRKKLVSFISEWSLKMKQAQVRLSYSFLLFNIFQEKRARLAEEKIAREKEAQIQREQQLSEQSRGIEGVKFVNGVGGTGKPLVVYPQLNFQPSYLFCVGSPIGLFLTIRQIIQYI